MKVQLQNIILLLIIMFLAVSSCHKEIDTQIPEITIFSPFEGQSFFVPDTIKVEAEISNDHILNNLQVGLVNDQFVSVLPPVYLPPKNTNNQIRLSFPVTELMIENGDYYFYIRAEDESDFKIEYQKIIIYGIPKVLEKIIVLTADEFGKYKVMAIGADNIIATLFNVNGDFASSEIDSKNRLLYIAGISLININAYNLDTHELDWLKPPLPPLPMHTKDCLFFDENLFASYASQYIYGYRNNGLVLFNAIIEENKLPSRIIKFGEFLLADLQSKSGGFNYLATYYLVSSVEKQRMATNYTVLNFHDAAKNQVLVIANMNGAGSLRLYNSSENKEKILINIQEKIISSLKLTDSNYIIGTNESLYLFNLNLNELSKILPGTIGYRLLFDPINQNIYITGGNKVEVIDYPELQKQNTILFEDSILNLHLFYNK